MNLQTETINPEHQNLDSLEPLDLVTVLLEDQTRAALAVFQARVSLAYAVEQAAQRLERGGRLLYVGAGTSGRLALLDAAELPPTFSWPPSRVVALLAGGREAMWEAQEGAEDDERAAVHDLLEQDPTPNDVVIALAASGRTPYAVAALEHARTLGCLTIGISNNSKSPLERVAEIPILLETGPEVISGSTRLKAGTAQKIALNTFSSAVMVRLGKVYGNRMVDLKATNEKLRIRALNLVLGLTQADEDSAKVALEQAQYKVPVAVLMLEQNVNVEQAVLRLEGAGGRLRVALEGDK